MGRYTSHPPWPPAQRRASRWAGQPDQSRRPLRRAHLPVDVSRLRLGHLMPARRTARRRHVLAGGIRLADEARATTAAQDGRGRAAGGQHQDPGHYLRPAAATDRRGRVHPARGGGQHGRHLGRDPVLQGVPGALNARGGPYPGSVHAPLRRPAGTPGERGNLFSGPAGAPPSGRCPGSGRGPGIVFSGPKGHMNLPKFAPRPSHFPGRPGSTITPPLRRIRPEVGGWRQGGTAGRGSPLPRGFVRGCQP
jgi:hypothetical protein